MTKQQIIDEQNVELASLQADNKQLRNIIVPLKRLMFGVEHYKTDDMELIPAYTKVVNERSERQGTENATLRALQEENSRLWYLVRAMADDQTLENDKSNYESFSTMAKTPFKKPTF